MCTLYRAQPETESERMEMSDNGEKRHGRRERGNETESHPKEMELVNCDRIVWAPVICACGNERRNSQRPMVRPIS